jgi:uncharacterized protein
MRATDVEDGRGRSSANVAGASVVGPAAPTASAAVVLRPLDFRAVELDDDGMLGAWQALSRSATIDHCIAQLQASGGGPGIRRSRRVSTCCCSATTSVAC